jgi:hypothetical protein
MSPYDRKDKEGFFMTPQSSQQAPHKGHGWLASLLPAILAAESFTLPVASAGLAVATEYQVTEDGGLVPSPALEVAPYMKSDRMVWGNWVNQEIAATGVRLSREIPKSACVSQAMITSIGKARANAQKPVMKFSVTPYDGKRRVYTIRTTPAEIEISARHKVTSMIGPVQEIQKPSLSEERSVDQLFLALTPFHNALQLSDNESSRMNLTTMLAMDNRNCVSGCP